MANRNHGRMAIQYCFCREHDPSKAGALAVSGVRIYRRVPRREGKRGAPRNTAMSVTCPAEPYSPLSNGEILDPGATISCKRNRFNRFRLHISIVDA